MTSDGSSQITNGFEDVNDAGLVDNGTSTPFNFTGSFTDTGHGRFELDLFNYIGASVFAAYPSSGGVFMLEIDNGGVAGGVAVTQASGATVAPSQGYGLNVSGEDLSGVPLSPPVEFDGVAEFKTTTSGMVSGVKTDDFAVEKKRRAGNRNVQQRSIFPTALGFERDALAFRQ